MQAVLRSTLERTVESTRLARGRLVRKMTLALLGTYAFMIVWNVLATLIPKLLSR